MIHRWASLHTSTSLIKSLGLALLLTLGLAAGCDSEGETGPATTSSSGTAAAGGSGGDTGGSGGLGGSGGDTGGSGGGTAVPVVKLPKASILPEELAIIVNSSDPQSVAVGAYYQQQRQIPAANVITVDFTADVSTMTEAEFYTVKAAVDAAAGPSIQAFALTWTRPYRVACMSVTSAFALGFDSQYCSTPCSATAAVDYFDSDSTSPYTDHGIRPAMTIAGASESDAMMFIDRGIAADGTFPTGDGYFIRTTDVARSVRWPVFISTVSAWDYPEGLALTYLDNASGSGLDYIENTPDVLFYFTGLVSVPAIETNTYLPGAIADHLTSVGGQIPQSGQMSILRWLEAGATASYGTVVEPCNYTEKFPNTQVLLPHYFRGQTVLEAYWKSVHWPGEGIFIGEPLARPWGGSTIDFADGTLTIRTTMLNPQKIYELRSAAEEQGPYDTVALADITVPHHQLATITLENATAPCYELTEATP